MFLSLFSLEAVVIEQSCYWPHAGHVVKPLGCRYISTSYSRFNHSTGQEGNVLFNDALNTFYLRLYHGIRHMVEDHSVREETHCCHMGYLVDPLSYFVFQPVLHNWCMCYPVCGMMHIKEPLLLIGKSCPCGAAAGFLSL